MRQDFESLPVAVFFKVYPVILISDAVLHGLTPHQDDKFLGTLLLLFDDLSVRFFWAPHRLFKSFCHSPPPHGFGLPKSSFPSFFLVEFFPHASGSVKPILLSVDASSPLFTQSGTHHGISSGPVFCLGGQTGVSAPSGRSSRKGTLAAITPR